MNSQRTGLLFILFGLMSLFGGILFGLIGSFQFVYPQVFEFLPFFKSRPLHVSMVIAWIFMTAIGGIYYYIPKYGKVKFCCEKLVKWHFIIFILTGLAVLTSYVLGQFGGREYWEFPPFLSIPIIISWVLFGINFYGTVFKSKNWPVYYWMWATGILFFFITFLEANAWILPVVRGNLVRDLTLQWKSYGALVGSWNMLVYGTSIFLMEKMSGSTRISMSRLSFLMYFLSLTNLMFGWAHHTYIVPAAPWIRIVSYSISMTELIIFGQIIWKWKSSLESAKRLANRMPYRFMMAAEVWIFINLGLALLISVPAINIYTHGTHITVAHAMGSTIGINSMILLSSVFFILRPSPENDVVRPRSVVIGFWLANVSLLIFLISLVIAGIIKGQLTINEQLAHAAIMERITPYLICFAISGIGLFIGLSLILAHAIREFWKMAISQYGREQ